MQGNQSSHDLVAQANYTSRNKILSMRNSKSSNVKLQLSITSHKFERLCSDCFQQKISRLEHQCKEEAAPTDADFCYCYVHLMQMTTAMRQYCVNGTNLLNACACNRSPTSQSPASPPAYSASHPSSNIVLLTLTSSVVKPSGLMTCIAPVPSFTL
jgi:hypothetical protein